jgi:oxygen-independent coproporphyrinogen III oxidase
MAKTVSEDPNQKTTVGSYFVSNYPPFSFWESDRRDLIEALVRKAPTVDTPLGLYVHLPFCRKRCHFCYFKVYTDKKSAEIRSYIDAVDQELAMYAGKPFLGGRTPSFIYFGGGTPSYLSSKQLQDLFGRLQSHLSWDAASEIAFECEPGTLSGDKLKVLRDLGVTRLSLGVENFNDELLELNGRAHRSAEIFERYDQAMALGFSQINIDLIAGMVGETPENWQRCIDKAIELKPHIITMYQMEVPFNTTMYQEMKAKNETIAPIADWETKRQWIHQAFACFESAGYAVSSAYSAVREGTQHEFLYRDHLWQGADLLSLGVSSFSHIQGTHFQNEKDFVPYMQAIQNGHYPIRRAMTLTEEEKLIREFILQLKKGTIDNQYFKRKFDVDVLERFAEPLHQLRQEKALQIRDDEIHLYRDGLLRIDSLLPHFYLPKHHGARYT